MPTWPASQPTSQPLKSLMTIGPSVRACVPIQLATDAARQTHGQPGPQQQRPRQKRDHDENISHGPTHTQTQRTSDGIQHSHHVRTHRHHGQQNSLNNRMVAAAVVVDADCADTAACCTEWSGKLAAASSPPDQRLARSAPDGWFARQSWPSMRFDAVVADVRNAQTHPCCLR